MAPHQQLPRLDLLGGFRLTDAAGRDIRVPGRKSRALLAILAVSPGLGTTRARLRGLLWADRGEQQAGDSLRQTLVALRRDLASVEPSPLVVHDDVVGLDPQLLAIDLLLFREAARGSDPARAAALYRGRLLEGLDFAGEEFEQWLGTQREALLADAIAVFERSVEHATGEARTEACRRLLVLDPVREESHRKLMQVHAEQGELALARKQFEVCRLALEKELGVAPSKETSDLLARLTRDATVREASAAEPASKPTVAILPFTNMSADPAQRYFSDGMTQDIVTELSRFRQLRVRAYHPSTRDSGSEQDPILIGRQLGVQYLVEGSVRRIGERIRINVQLIDIESGQHLWAERFDRHQEEIFSVQDQVVRTIVATLVGRVQSAGVERARRKPPANLAAYECLLRADALPIGVPEAEAEARLLYQKAVRLDPGYARAYMMLSVSFTLEWYRDMSGSDRLLDDALAAAQKAVLLDEDDELCQATLGRAHLLRGSHELAEHYHLRALELNPNSTLLMADLGILYGFLGEPERGVEYLKAAKLLDPLFDPTWYWRNRGVVHFIARQYGEAITALNRSPILPDWVHAYLAASYAHTNAMDDARRHAAEVLRLSPDFSLNRLSSKDPFKRSQDRQHLVDGLRKAGLPE